MKFFANPLAKWLSVSALIIIFDQLTKQIVEHSFEHYERVAVTPFFNLTLAYNEGAAFSFLANESGWQRWFFILLTLVITIILVRWLSKTTIKMEQWAISLVIGGAIGNNFIDRLFYGHVIDFLDFYYQQHHWPAFNVADIAISGGVALLILSTILHKPGEDRA